MNDYDSLHRFLFEHLSVRGEIIHLDTTWRTVLERRDYPPPIRRILGEAMAATALLAATIKFDGLLSLQLQGQGALRLLLVQCTSEGTLRGLARWQGEVAETSLYDLSGGGVLVINIDPGQGRESYQGVVELTGISLAAALEHYFSRSEQLATRLHLVADERSAAGLLLQHVPGEAIDSDAWDRLQCLTSTLTEAELLGLNAREILRRLFHEDDVRLFESQPISFRCTCSRERTANMLRSLGYDEIQDILADQKNVSVNCEFCGMEYIFDPVDAETLFAKFVQPSAPLTRH